MRFVYVILALMLAAGCGHKSAKIDYSPKAVVGDVASIVKASPLPVHPSMKLNVVNVFIGENRADTTITYRGSASMTELLDWYAKRLKGFRKEKSARVKDTVSVIFRRKAAKSGEAVFVKIHQDGKRAAEVAVSDQRLPTTQQRAILASLSPKRVLLPEDAMPNGVAYTCALKSPQFSRAISHVIAYYTARESLIELHAWFHSQLPDLQDIEAPAPTGGMKSRIWRGPSLGEGAFAYTIIAAQGTDDTAIVVTEVLKP
ncbi:MAG: hypothetical protein WCL39_01085 [Armatimonadota bacterium]